MFLETDTDERITLWREFRESLTHSKNPLQDIVDLWKTAPVVDRNLDPWNSQRWPTPWELLEENRFCPVAIPLMMGWTAKLSTKLSTSLVLIKTFIDHSEQRYYNVCMVDDNVLNYKPSVMKEHNLQSTMHCQYSTELS